MNTRNLVLILAATVLALTAGCPKLQDGGKQANVAPAPPNTAKSAPVAKPAIPEPEDEAPAEVAPETLIKQTLNSMLEALNTEDLDKYTACFHPESRELEEMLGFFEEFDNTKQKVEFAKLSVEEIKGNEALAEYTLLIINQEDESDTAKDSGEFELVLHDGNWVIIDLD